MASVLEGFISSRRRPSRSRSESGKQLHARWGDVAITAPNGGWTQHFLEDDLHNVTYQAHDSPDSQKTLVNNSPDLSFKDEIEKGGLEAVRTQSPPLVQKERGAITITIPLPWSRKSHRRSSSASGQQQQQQQQQPQPVPLPEKVITAESRPAHTQITNTIDAVIVAESRLASDTIRADSPIIHTQSPVYDDVSTFFTRAVFPEKHPGPTRLPQIQTSVPPNKSQPASAVSMSMLSPVAEKYNGLSESNNATPLENTPIARHIESALPINQDGQVDLTGLVGRLESQARTTPPMFSPTPSSDEAPDTAIERPDSRSTPKVPSRPSSRGPGIGEVAYMRSSSRGTLEHGGGRRSASREAAGTRNASAEPLRRRALSRDPVGRRADSPSFISRRAASREPSVRRAESPEPKTRRALSRGRGVHESVSPEAGITHVLSDDLPLRPRAESPGPRNRRAQSRDPSVRREVSPPGFSRRAFSRDPYTRRRISGEFGQRAVSVDPVFGRTSPKDGTVPRHASPRDDIFARQASPREKENSTSARGTPVLATAGSNSPMGLSAPDEPAAADEATDIETETDEMYFESRKGWNGTAVTGISSKGFYGDVVQDYKLIARDVEAEIAASEPQGSGINIVNLIKKEKEREAHKPKMEAAKEEKVYEGPDLVPPQEELWG